MCYHMYCESFHCTLCMCVKCLTQFYFNFQYRLQRNVAKGWPHLTSNSGLDHQTQKLSISSVVLYKKTFVNRTLGLETNLQWPIHWLTWTIWLSVVMTSLACIMSAAICSMRSFWTSAFSSSACSCCSTGVTCFWHCVCSLCDVCAILWGDSMPVTSSQ